MKIGIDISQIVYKGTGVARFTEGLVNAILTYDKNNQWFFFFSGFRRKLDEDLENKIKDHKHKLIKWKIPPTLLSILFNNLHNFSKLFTFNFSFLTSLDWFITSDWTETPVKCKKATVVHDLAYLRYPELSYPNIIRTQKQKLNWVTRESEIIFADSQATKDDLVKLQQIDEERIKVNYPGIGIKNSTKKIRHKNPFILTVGKIEPRKNLGRLIEAFKELNPKGIRLLIVGPEGWDKDLKASSNVRFTGYVSDEELESLYLSCLFFVYPSIWEGFGYPVLEAMNLGTPVATSNTSSLKEIGDGAVLLFNPLKVTEIKNALQRMIEDAQLRKDLSLKGKKRSKFFTWENYYKNLIKVLENK